MQGASVGVDGFFVLSGFLITCLLLQEWQQRGAISLKRFYVRRALRLLPALYVMLALLCIIALVSLKGVGAIATWRGIVLSFMYSTNLVSLFFNDYYIGVGLMSHGWSLALEEQFYFVWPVLLIGLLSLRLTTKQLVACIGVLIAAAPLWRFWILSNGHAPILALYTRADVLLAGCALGVLTARGVLVPSRSAARFTRFLVLAGIALLVYQTSDPTWPSNISAEYRLILFQTLLALGPAALILHLVVSPQGRLARLLSWKPLVQVGIVSYGIYLWHNPVFFLVSPGSAGWLDLPVQIARLAITAVFVTLSYRYIERPALRIKERFSTASRSAVVEPRTQVAASTAQNENVPVSL
jgi:peptidoglycan/LPS O-acetylase OafA/YrhL